MTDNPKVVLLGDAGVGKTSILNRFIFDKFDMVVVSTFIPGFYQKSVAVPGGFSPMPLQIWDTAGQEIYHSTATFYYKKAAAAVVVYDLTKKATFETAKSWIEEVRNVVSDDILIVLVGNKLDLLADQKVSLATIEAYAKEAGINSILASAKDNIGIKNIFEYIAQELSMCTDTFTTCKANHIECLSLSTSYSSVAQRRVTVSVNSFARKKSNCC
eukprot:TRINITY_DN7113_c0_g1_i6.p1 TRINITY_DN7113_c0_g1~~TRINITY_DN7113_c0_g1_i6.p1  ORF type:complete len:215 (-),score=43.59 TRINITY_DN7113_c0_g1_i6:118-762(-)